MVQKDNREFATTALMHRLRVSALADQSDHQLLARFVADADEAAFEALVNRHGGLVFRVCHRFLPNRQDTEDAFQATFLILARKARILEKEKSLSSWLWGVALRVAKKAQTKLARRKKITGDEMPMDRVPDSHPNGLPESRLLLRELAQALEEEIAQLPKRYRDPFVLCHQQDHSREEAATKLGCSVATLHRNLKQARCRLQRRLGNRLALEGVPYTTVLAASALLSGEVTAAPASLVAQTVRTAMLCVSGTAGKGSVPAGVIALANAAGGERGIGLLQVVGMILLGAASTGAWAALAMPRPGDTIDRPAPVLPTTPAPAPVATPPKTDPATLIGPDVREDILRHQVAPKVLAVLQGVAGKAQLHRTWIDPDTQTAHLVASWRVEPLKEATVHIKYQIPTERWEFWTDLYNGQLRKIDPKKPIILIQVPGWEFALKVPAMVEMQEAFRALQQRHEVR